VRWSGNRLGASRCVRMTDRCWSSSNSVGNGACHAVASAISRCARTTIAAATIEADGTWTARTAPRRLVGITALLATARQEVMSKRSEPRSQPMARRIVPGWAYESVTARAASPLADVDAWTARRGLANGRSGKI
jgi:hypothetical protein